MTRYLNEKLVFGICCLLATIDHRLAALSISWQRINTSLVQHSTLW